jgi:hypothetical protein
MCGKKVIIVTLCALLLFSVLAFASVSLGQQKALADEDTFYSTASDGSFDVLILENGDWRCKGEFSFRDYETRQLALENEAGQLKLRLVQHGHDAAFIDYIALQKDAETCLPISAVNIDNSADVLGKVVSPEYDVCDAWNSTLEIIWDNVPENTTLVMRAMEEDLGENHGGPLYYPYIPCGYTLGHILVNDGGITVDGLLEEPTGPDFSAFWMPSSPHPDGYTYGWLHSDGEYLYAAVEVTADNTPDEEDWGAIYVVVNGELEEFRVSGNAIKWGALGFQYTSSVPYEHRIYEFAIPLSEINASIGDNLQYGFGAYGTVAGYQVLIQTVPINTGYIDFDGANKVHGDVVWMDWDGNYPIVAHPGPGYVFSEWQVKGGVLVDEPYEATTNCSSPENTEAAHVLTMVQTSPASSVPTMSQWGMIGMAIVLAAALVWSVRRRWVVSADKS